jgi:Catalase
MFACHILGARSGAGAKFLTDDEAHKVGEYNMRHSHATHDLYNAIAKGDFPAWKFYIQTMSPSQQLDFDFDPLDATKVRPLLKLKGYTSSYLACSIKRNMTFGTYLGATNRILIFVMHAVGKQYLGVGGILLIVGERSK